MIKFFLFYEDNMVLFKPATDIPHSLKIHLIETNVFKLSEKLMTDCDRLTGQLRRYCIVLAEYAVNLHFNMSKEAL